MSCGPVNAEGAAVGEHHDKRLACGGHGFQKRLFRPGQVEAGAVAAREAFLVHFHLLAFQLAGDAGHGDDDIRIAGRGHRRWIGIDINLRPDQPRCRVRVRALRVHHQHLVGLALFQMHAT